VMAVQHPSPSGQHLSSPSRWGIYFNAGFRWKAPEGSSPEVRQQYSELNTLAGQRGDRKTSAANFKKIDALLQSLRNPPLELDLKPEWVA
jgi:hypothetical protein